MDKTYCTVTVQLPLCRHEALHAWGIVEKHLFCTYFSSKSCCKLFSSCFYNTTQNGKEDFKKLPTNSKFLSYIFAWKICYEHGLLQILVFLFNTSGKNRHADYVVEVFKKINENNERKAYEANSRS